ncbi:SH3 domain-containing protein [Pseudothauera lacus]|uniref:SH3b domain-containing protein n=1 Tax=Pseudothauera lacus TaxID=2136175 RepID=A0A2T4IGC5_9RHOO|nr:SH3 domain-containing protein [Pseudothauera lacus]PTD96824.1 hypothetical protein C8261_08430 [Pseudothauera lacus]
MSLINDVLRDMDRRQARPHGLSTLVDDTVTVPPLHPRRWPPSWALLLGVGLALGVLGGYLLYGQQRAAGHDQRAVDAMIRTPAAEPAAASAALIAPPAAPTPEAAAHTPAASPSSPMAEDAQIPSAEAAEAPSAEAAEAPSAEATAPPAANPAPVTTAAPPATAPARQVFIAPGKRVNLRAAPSLDSTVLHVISARSDLLLVDSHPHFLQIRTADGTTGWVSRDFAALEPYAAAPTEAAPPELATQATAPPPAPANPATAPAARAAGEQLNALRALERGDSAAAESALRRALAADPGHSEALNTLAALLLRQQRSAELEALLADLLHVPRAAVLHARLLADRGDAAGALRSLEGVGEDSLDGEALTVLGALRQRVGRHAEAVAAYRKAIARGQRAATTWAGLAISLEALAEHGPARSAWEQTLAATPLDPALERHARSRLSVLRGTGD